MSAPKNITKSQAIITSEQEKILLDRPTCVVTGSSRGIGRAIAIALGRSQARVVINYNSSHELAQETVRTIKQQGGEAVTHRADVSDEAQVDGLFRTARDEFGSVDVLVNNAGITVDKKFSDLTYEDWRRVLEVNLDGGLSLFETVL